MGKGQPRPQIYNRNLVMTSCNGSFKEGFLAEENINGNLGGVAALSKMLQVNEGGSSITYRS